MGVAAVTAGAGAGAGVALAFPSSASTQTRPIAANTIAVANEAWKPAVSAASGSGPWAWDTATVVTIAAPSAPPIWNAALLSPDASPASRSDTPLSVATEAATNVEPRPGPKISRPRNMSAK